MSASTMADAGSDSARGALDWKLRLVVRVGALVVRALGATWRLRIVNDQGVRDLRASRSPLAFALWHGEMLPLLYQHRGEGVAVLISEHRDGEVIAQIAKRLGFATVRGSTSRGAGRALIALGRLLADGRDVAVTPDGPRGPARVFAPGTLVAAFRARAPIVGIGVVASRAWHLRSWDRFLIPKPFARVTIAYSAPTMVNASDVRDAGARVAEFEALMAVTRQAADA